MRKKHRTCEKKAGLINSTSVPPTPLHSAKFYHFISQVVILFRWIEPLKKRLSMPAPNPVNLSVTETLIHLFLTYTIHRST